MNMLNQRLSGHGSSWGQVGLKLDILKDIVGFRGSTGAFKVAEPTVQAQTVGTLCSGQSEKKDNLIGQCPVVEVLKHLV